MQKAVGAKKTSGIRRAKPESGPTPGPAAETVPEAVTQTAETEPPVEPVLKAKIPPQPEAKTEAKPKAEPSREKPNGETAGYAISDPAEFGRNMARVASKSQRLLSEFFKHQTDHKGGEPLDPLNLTGAFSTLYKEMTAHPERLMQAQFALWKDTMTLWKRTAERAMGKEVDPVVVPAPGDRRFRDKDWENPVFDFIKQSYLLASNWLQHTVAEAGGGDSNKKGQARAAFYARQFTEALSPSNFVLTNPEVLRETLKSNGENLVKGLDNLLADLDRGQGQLSIRQTTDNFLVGRDIATTPGKVVFRNALFELLQYSPVSETAYETPLLIFPPWINKFYILDLQPKNSFVKWAVERGYTVFIVSWVNPDASLANKDFNDYMREGIFAALDAVEKATGQKEVNCIGYCIAGTLLSATLAYIAASGEYADRIKSATFLAAQTDFSEAGELLVFVDDAQLKALEQQMRAAGGVLEGSKMATTFNMLRANDLIWSFVVNNYLLGKEPVPFDLLYWNSDTTRMPMKLHLQYLRSCYRDNALAQAEMVLGGERLNLAKIKTPVFFQAAKEDHIAPADSVYKGAKLFGGDVTYMLAGSGHIAGVVNPPSSGKYQHWTNPELPATLAEWQAGAAEHVGSWWPTWDIWLAARSGQTIPAPKPGDGELDVLGDAPGTYVLVKAGSLNKQSKT
jgi:poly[(R)-3-hydroxyalkanoate] polymerase subunit PhaC